MARKMGADYLAYALTDAIVDNYFVILEKIGGNAESIEEELVTQTKTGNVTDNSLFKKRANILTQVGLAVERGSQWFRKRGITAD